METIYSRYRTGNPSFEGTLSLMQDLISTRLLPGFRRVWIQGSNSGKAKIVFTIFENGKDYRMEFLNFSNFRQYRPVPVGDENITKFETEVRLMEEIISRLRIGPLAGVIS
jgi:hypothetical protein